jgi:hypothetical protein
MNKISKSAAAAVIAVSAGTLLVMAEPALAAPHRAEVNYCMSYDQGATDCHRVPRSFFLNSHDDGPNSPTNPGSGGTMWNGRSASEYGGS